MTRSLSVVIPVFNEEHRIAPSLRLLNEYFTRERYDVEILVVDDGSRDRTVAVVEECRRHIPQIRVIRYGRNRGPGYAVRTGVLAATRESILYTDADLSTPIEDISRLWPWYDRGFDIVMASRYVQHSALEVLQPFHRRIMGRVFRMLGSMFCVRGFRDTQCGFKLFRGTEVRRIFSRVRSNRFTFNLEVLMHARRQNLKIAEVPVRWRDVDGSRIRVLGESFRSLIEILQVGGVLPTPD